ncbi:MAG: YeeE/YedE family protein [Hyphomicrobiales bacterium]
MESVREALLVNSAASLAIGGLLIGLVFGAIVHRTNFCTMGSISDILSFGDYKRFRAWLLAIAVSILGSQAIADLGWVNLGKSMYMAPAFNWTGNLIGGLLFGFGMVFAGGCASRNLVRAGGGDLRSLIVLIIVGIFAYMTIGGLIGPLRAELQSATQIDLAGPLSIPDQGMGSILGALTGISSSAARWALAVVIAGAFIAYCFKDEGFRKSPSNIVAGIGIGGCVIAGWALTGLAFDEFADRAQDPISLTYVRPVGDATEYLMRFTAGMIPGVGVATVFGALLGAFLSALAKGSFQVTTFADKGDTLRNLSGAALMGIGGVMALGCTIGQAITGMSTLAIGSLVTFVAIVIGGVLGVKALERILLAG